MEEVTGDWKRLHNEEVRNLYASHNIIRVIKSRRWIWAGYVARLRKTRNVYKNFTGKTARNRPLRRHRRRWEDNVRLDIREIRW
jgi:hypothetical protein